MSHRLRSLALAVLASAGLAAASAAPASAGISNVNLPSFIEGEVVWGVGAGCQPPYESVPLTFNSTTSGKLYVWSSASRSFPNVEERPVVRGANQVSLSLSHISPSETGLTTGRLTVLMLPVDRYGLPAGGIVVRTVNLRCDTRIG